MNRKTTTASLIKDARARAGMSQVKLAKKARVSPEWLCRIESGNRFPSAFALERIAAALKVKVERLIVPPHISVNGKHQPKRKK